MEENRGYIEGIIPFLKNIPHRDWMAMEKATKNHYYCFQGRFDAIVEIEWVIFNLFNLLKQLTILEVNQHSLIGKQLAVHPTNIMESMIFDDFTVFHFKLLHILSQSTPILIIRTCLELVKYTLSKTVTKAEFTFQIKQGAVVLAYEDGRPAEAVIIHEDELKVGAFIYFLYILQ